MVFERTRFMMIYFCGKNLPCSFHFKLFLFFMNDAANLRVIFTPENKFEKVNPKNDKP
jgi:hypothetical protein